MTERKDSPIPGTRRLDRKLRQAVLLHQAGQTARADTAYRDILAEATDHPGALHGLGLLALQSGQPDAAIARIGQAARLVPDSAAYHLDLGLALREAGHLEQARAAFSVASLLDATDPTPLAAMAGALARLDRLADAEAAYLAASALAPHRADLRHAAGLARRAQGKIAAAAESFQEAVALAPADIEARNSLGAALTALGEPAAAEAQFRAALALQPAHLGALNNLALALQDQDRLDEAEAALREAMRLAPDHPDLANNLGVVLRDAGRLDEALDCFDRSLRAAPDHADAHLNAASVLLMQGDFARGWPEFEWRERVAGAVRPDFGVPRWQGEALAGRTLLVHAEMGLGDTIQFCRYLTLIEGDVVLQAPASLIGLLTGQFPARIVARGDALPAYDLHCPLLSLPGLFGTDLSSIPAETPYLRADPDKVAAWRARLAAKPGPLVGLCWAGSATYARDRVRSLAPPLLDGLAAIPDATFVSLQKDAARTPTLPLLDWTAELADLSDTAALIAALDVVVSVDTAVAHLAGALGQRVLLLDRFSGDWRWFRDRVDSPWYPTLRICRQRAPGDWPSAVASAAAALVT